MNIIRAGILIVTIVCAVFILSYYYKYKSMSNALPMPSSVVDVASLLAASPGSMEEVSVGRKDAPVTIVEYISMTCGYCAEFHNTTFKKIEDKYIKTGKVRYILREFPLDPVAKAAIMLARCAEQRSKGGYLGFVSMLLKRQNDWIMSDNIRDSLMNMAKFAGFSQNDFDSCVHNQRILDDINAEQKRASSMFGVYSTPSFFIGGNLYLGAMPEDVLFKIIDQMLQNNKQ
ncbi:MAG: DsbA family protein [Candidatus Liberibacter ctenarytainae]|uniref:DsbA family protein n=1 Tax=Candidatus Liberibacter ctenarytainae TaxID=2020335 RepID=A0A937DLT6_9HYPH|nr:DsbA family protein [Candidatus Liberibacter ctenarytainae]